MSDATNDDKYRRWNNNTGQWEVYDINIDQWNIVHGIGMDTPPEVPKLKAAETKAPEPPIQSPKFFPKFFKEDTDEE